MSPIETPCTRSVPRASAAEPFGSSPGFWPFVGKATHPAFADAQARMYSGFAFAAGIAGAT